MMMMMMMLVTKTTTRGIIINSQWLIIFGHWSDIYLFIYFSYWKLFSLVLLLCSGKKTRLPWPSIYWYICLFVYHFIDLSIIIWIYGICSFFFNSIHQFSGSSIFFHMFKTWWHLCSWFGKRVNKFANTVEKKRKTHEFAIIFFWSINDEKSRV